MSTPDPTQAAAPVASPFEAAPVQPGPPGFDAATLASRHGLEGALERVAAEMLHERQRERRWRNFFRLAWLCLAAALLWLGFAHRLTPGVPNTPHTALVEVHGEIGADTEANAEALVGALKSAFEDASAQAVVLRINSPGGSPVQSGIVNDEIKRLKAKHHKKVYAVVEEMCASGAYYIAVAADEIYVDKASIVGSIGVVMEGFGFAGLMEKLGVERRLYTAGENKAMLDPFSPAKERHVRLNQALLDQIHRQFIAVVKEGRGERLKETPDTFSGLFWNGEEAVRLGLADQLGNLDYVAREVIKAEDIVDYTPRENVAERLAKRFGASVGAGAVKALHAMAPLR
jgi:protease-4